ncbi:MAG: hypothetical protein U0325_20710 [Polyangiales bacterium]
MRRRALPAFAALLTLATVPRGWCGRGAAGMVHGERDAQAPFARAVAREVCDGARVGTGSAHFDGEWALVSYQLALLGMGQVARAHPTEPAGLRDAMTRCGRRLMAPEARSFGTARWGEDGLASLASPHGHAYLGYLAMGLGMLRAVDPQNPTAAVHDALIAALARRLEAAPAGLVETYPGEAYPPDVASVVGAIGLHASATGTDRRALIARWSQTFRARYVHPGSGYVVQRATLAGDPLDAPRGSGTAVTAYFVSFADPALARDLARAVLRGVGTVAGFGGVREYPAGWSGAGDIDSGPVLMGVSVSGTAFGFASARLLRDEARFTALWRTAYLFGAPRARGDGWSYPAAGALGNALLLAMMTAEARP